jgi:hypothetical protein
VLMMPPFVAISILENAIGDLVPLRVAAASRRSTSCPRDALFRSVPRTFEPLFIGQVLIR